MTSRMAKWWRQRGRERRRHVTDLVFSETGGVVSGGPFAGLRYPSPHSAGSALAPKLAGSYEREIHGFVEQALGRNPARVINIGAGEGYYAVGAALRLPKTRVHAFELDSAAREMCGALAQANHVVDRVSVHDECTIDELREFTTEPALVICDVEGAERELLDPSSVPGLRSCEIIAELHGADGADMVKEIGRRFSSTHRDCRAHFSRRIPEDARSLGHLSRADRAIAVDERRRHGLDWIHLVPVARVIP